MSPRKGLFRIGKDRLPTIIFLEDVLVFGGVTKKKPFHFPLNPGCLMTGSLFHGLWNNPHITWVPYPIPSKSPKQPFGPFFRAAQPISLGNNRWLMLPASPTTESFKLHQKRTDPWFRSCSSYLTRFSLVHKQVFFRVIICRIESAFVWRKNCSTKQHLKRSFCCSSIPTSFQYGSAKNHIRLDMPEGDFLRDSHFSGQITLIHKPELRIIWGGFPN